MAAVSGGALFGTQGGIAGLGGTGLTTTGIGEVAGGLAGAYGGFQQAAGYETEAKIYGEGATEARTQAGLAENVEDIQAFQLNRKVALTESAQRAAAATNGLGEAGSALSLLRESQQQGNEAKGNLLFNTVQKVGQLQTQATAADMQSQAAKDAAEGSMVGGILKGVSSVVSLAGMF